MFLRQLVGGREKRTAKGYYVEKMTAEMNLALLPTFNLPLEAKSTLLGQPRTRTLTVWLSRPIFLGKYFSPIFVLDGEFCYCH